MLLLFVELGQDAVIYRADTGLAAFFTVVAAAVQLVLLFCLWQGLLDMPRDAGITPPAPSPTTSTSSPNSRDYSIMSTRTAASSTP